jgi:hypothetical protein
VQNSDDADISRDQWSTSDNSSSDEELTEEPSKMELDPGEVESEEFTSYQNLETSDVGQMVRCPLYLDLISKADLWQRVWICRQIKLSNLSTIGFKLQTKHCDFRCSAIDRLIQFGGMGISMMIGEISLSSPCEL